MSGKIFRAAAAAIVIATAITVLAAPAASDQEAALTESVPVAEKVRDAIVGKLWYGRFRLCLGGGAGCNGYYASLRFSGDENLEVTIPSRGPPKKVPARIDEDGKILFVTPRGATVVLTLQPNGTELKGGFMTSGSTFALDGSMDFTRVD